MRLGHDMIYGYSNIVDFLEKGFNVNGVIYTVGDLLFGAGLATLLTIIILKNIVF